MPLKSTHKDTDIGKHLIFSGFMSAIFVLCFVMELKIALVIFFAAGSGLLALAYQEFDIRPLHLIVALVFISAFAPLIKLSDSIPGIRPEQFLFLSIFPALLIFQEREEYPELQFFIRFFIAFQLLQLFSIFYGAAVMGTSVGYKDLVEVIRVLQYGLVAYIIGHFSARKNEIQNVLYLLVAVFAGVTLLGLFQYFGILGFDRLTAPIYLQNNYNWVYERVMGTFINPNTFGSFVAVGAIISLGFLFYEKRKLPKLILFFVFLMLSMTVALTESRTALVAYFAGLISLILLYSYGNNLKWYQTGLIFLTFLFVIAGIGIVLSDEIISRFETLLNFMEDISWQMRLFAWYVNINVFLDSPLFGWGPGFHQFTPTVDSDYILILRRYGAVGFILYLSFYFIPIIYAFKNLNRDRLTTYFNKIFIAASVIFLVSNIPNSLFHEMQFMSFWCVFLGVLYAINRKKHSD